MVRVQLAKKKKQARRKELNESTLDSLLSFGDYMAMDRELDTKNKRGGGRNKGGGKVSNHRVLIGQVQSSFSFRRRRSRGRRRSECDERARLHPETSDQPSFLRYKKDPFIVERVEKEATQQLQLQNNNNS